VSAKCSGAGNASGEEGGSSVDSDGDCCAWEAVPAAVWRCPFTTAVAEAPLRASEGVGLWSMGEH
jgi:hypothetical protein